MVGLRCDPVPCTNRGARLDTSERKDASALDSPYSCDMSVLTIVQSGVETAVVLAVVGGTSCCAVVVAPCASFPCYAKAFCPLGLRRSMEALLVAN